MPGRTLSIGDRRWECTEVRDLEVVLLRHQLRRSDAVIVGHVHVSEAVEIGRYLHVSSSHSTGAFDLRRESLGPLRPIAFRLLDVRISVVPV